MRIRKLESFDLKTRVAWMNDSRVYSSMHFDVPVLLENTVNWFNNNRGKNTRADVTICSDDGDIVAFGGITSISAQNEKGELYIFVNPEMQGHGIGVKATGLLCRYGFDELNLHKIYLYTNESNIAARKTYERVGFKLEGVHRDENLVNGCKYEDRLYYGLLAEDLDDTVSYKTSFAVKDVILDEMYIDGLSVKMIRDDIYPFVGGGSKARKAVAYEKFLKSGGYNAMVTCGGVQSNHNRAMALMCARNGWKCHLCIQGTEERFYSEKGNALIDRLAGAECELISPEDTAVAMDRAMAKLKAEGYNPYYVHGGGHDLPGGTCFVEAVEDLKRQCDVSGWKPDYVFLASGTGSTQAGIAVGFDKVGWSDVKLVGISVARQQERGRQVIVDFANMLAEHYGMPKDYDRKIQFTADYLMGGYEQFVPEMKEYLDGVMAKTGVLFDTTYSGKGFWGMMHEVKRLGLQDKKILFWHTGGIMNIMK